MSERRSIRVTFGIVEPSGRSVLSLVIRLSPISSLTGTISKMKGDDVMQSARTSGPQTWKQDRPINIHWISLEYHTFKRWPIDIYRISCASWDLYQTHKVSLIPLNGRQSSQISANMQMQIFGLICMVRCCHIGVAQLNLVNGNKITNGMICVVRPSTYSCPDAPCSYSARWWSTRWWTSSWAISSKATTAPSSGAWRAFS